MVRTSSPGTYSRTSANSTPRPLKTLRYCPPNVSLTSRFVRISMRRTCARTSLAIMQHLRYFDGLEDVLEDVLGLNAFGFGFVADDDAVAQHVQSDGLDVFGRH